LDDWCYNCFINNNKKIALQAKIELLEEMFLNEEITQSQFVTKRKALRAKINALNG